MAYKHLKQYYDTICAQYFEMKDNLKYLEDEATNNMVSPEQIDNYKKLIEPLKTNYEQISYIMYLIHKPQRKEKSAKYIKMNKNFIKNFNEANSTENRVIANKKLLEAQRENRRTCKETKPTD